MTTLMLAVALFLLVNLVLALIVAARGPTPADRMLMALLIGTTGTGVLVLLAQTMHLPALVDVALVLVGGAHVVEGLHLDLVHDLHLGDGAAELLDG